MYDIDKIRENLEKEQELSLGWGYCFKDMLEWWDNHQHYPHIYNESYLKTILDWDLIWIFVLIEKWAINDGRG